MHFKNFIQNKKFLPLSILCVMFLGAPASVFSAEHLLSPEIIDVVVQPRDILTEKIVLENKSPARITLYPSVNNVTPGTEGGIQEFVSPSMSDRTVSLANWIELNRGGVELNPGESREVELTIRVHQDAKPGTYHAMIAYAPGRTNEEAFALIRARAVPVTLINARIEEKKNEWLKLSQFSIKKFLLSPVEDSISYTVENTGDAELVPGGDIIFYNQRGEEKASMQLNDLRRSIKPGASEVFKMKVPESGLFGKHKAFLTVRYGSGQAAVYDTTYFYVLPWKKLAVAFAVFFIVILSLVLWLHRKYSKDTSDDGDYVPFVVRNTESIPHHRDVVMKK